ncbi:MAG: NAD(P)/FAD-dependent oxidoreductase, partial [Bacteroidota bacterium]
MNTLETDYLIIGAGAASMAFVDTLLTETNDRVLIVDRYAKPGGHWNYAYPFVTLHQPSQFYGVASKELSNERIDTQGFNKGLSSLASGAEIVAYYEVLMRDIFIPTGRVQYFPLCNYEGNHQFRSILTSKKYLVKVAKKVVDCTYSQTA